MTEQDIASSIPYLVGLAVFLVIVFTAWNFVGESIGWPQKPPPVGDGKGGAAVIGKQVTMQDHASDEYIWARLELGEVDGDCPAPMDM